MESSMDKREREAGLNLAGNDPMSGRRGGMKTPTMDEREAAAGLNLRGNNTMWGWFETQGRLAGEPMGQRDSEDQTETVEIKRSVAPGGNIHAFQLVRADATTLCVRQGTIGSTIPTISMTELAVDYTDNVLSIPGTGTREYWIKVTLASGSITAVTIETSEPSIDTATQAKLLLGSVETDSGDIVAFTSNLSGSQALASCGSIHYFGLV